MEYLKWAEADLENGVLRLRDAKAGPRNVALPAAAIAILSAQPRDSLHVIPDADRSPRTTLPPVGGRAPSGARTGRRTNPRPAPHVRQLGRARRRQRPHDAGAPRPCVPRQTSAYVARLDGDPLRAAAEKIGSRIAAALDGTELAEVRHLGA